MPEWVVNRVAEALNSRQKAINGSRILVLGLAYKANVDDDRESPSYVLMEKLFQRGAQVDYHDPYVPVIEFVREHGRWAGVCSVAWEQKIIGAYDLVLISTAHSKVNYHELLTWSPMIVDTRNITASLPAKPGQVWKA